MVLYWATAWREEQWMLQLQQPIAKYQELILQYV